jgi:choline-sulfatase
MRRPSTEKTTNECRRIAIVSLLVWAAAGAGCDASSPNFAAPTARSNILLVTIDTLRADRIGCYGFALARTPNMDALAKDGVRCAEAIAPAPITLPSHASILTGLYPSAHGVRDNGAYALPDEAVTLQELLKNQGYDTAAFVSAVVLGRRYNLAQGFDVYDDELWTEDAPPLFMIRERPANRTVGRALEWLAARAARAERRPFFVWVHLFEPHQPYKPAPADRVLAPSPYDAEIVGVDREIGRLFDGISKVADDTLVVLTADHGESLGEHGEKTHGVFVYDATVRVPLIFRHPRLLARGKVIDAPVRTIDVTPTVLGSIGARTGRAFQGIDLWPALTGTAAVPDVSQYSESLLSEAGFGMAPLFAIRHRGMKAIRAPRPELYDLRADPDEKRDIRKKSPDAWRALDLELGAVLEESARLGLKPVASPMDAETLEALQALGYVATPDLKKSLGGMDPKDGMALRQLVEDARHAIQRRRDAEAESKLGMVLAKTPANVTVINMLGLLDLRAGKPEDARRHYETSLGVDPRQHRVLAQIGRIHLESGDDDAATNEYERAVALAPKFVEGLVALGFIALKRGDKDAADGWYAKAVAADPAYPHAWFRYGDLYFVREEWGEALRCYQKALETLPAHFDLTIQAGLAAQRAGDTALAADYQRRAASMRPDSWVPIYNLACLEATGGRPGPALTLLREAVDRGLDDPALLASDPDLISVRSDPAFAALVAEVGGRRN